MATASPDLSNYCRSVAESAATASRTLATVSGRVKNDWLRASASRLLQSIDHLLGANQKDLEAASGYGLTDAQVDRLRLSGERIQGIADGLLQVAALPDPVGETIEAARRPNGLHVARTRAPLGVVLFIYESRPNVTADAAAICVKSGNAVILRGGKEALHSSQAIVEVLHATAAETGLPAEGIQFIETIDRAAVGELLRLGDLIDVAIPRGGEGLIRRVSAEAVMPVIKHFTGNCHVYLHVDAPLQRAVDITVNSKCQRMGVCNACESLLVHRGSAERLLPPVAAALQQQGVELRGDDASRRLVSTIQPATEEDYGTEFLGPLISVRLVDSVGEAIGHINRYGSGHTDAIVTEDIATAEQFVQGVDSAAVIVNASTRFHDGFEFGMGAEIGISTDKFHARGPCGLKELTTYKFVVRGDGQLK